MWLEQSCLSAGHPVAIRSTARHFMHGVPLCLDFEAVRLGWINDERSASVKM
jgi:hypothetical protein